jgi:hypothetical protein
MVPGAIGALGMCDNGVFIEIEDTGRLYLYDVSRHHCSLRFDFSLIDLQCVHPNPIPISQGFQANICFAAPAWQ